MTLLTFSSVAMEFGADTLFREVSFTVAQGERWGVVGRNGTGKTTLLRLITGALQPASGSITRRPNLRIALLDQHRDFGKAGTIWEAAAQGYRELMALERELARESERLGELGNSVTSADLKRFDDAQERFLHQGGYGFHARVDAVLQGLGFDAQEARERPLAGLSGGERGRVGLAAQLAAPADLLLLDEPTNHLDLETIEWLQRHLTEPGRTVIVISHDRAFLDEMADHILHFGHGSASAYTGGYSSFVIQRDEALLAQERRAAEQKKEIARQEDFIRRNIAGQKTGQAQSRRKLLARLPRLSPPPAEEDPMAVRFELSARGGDQVLVLDGLGVGIGGRILLTGFSVVAKRGDVIAVVGPNGSGKSTLLATLLGERAPTRGTVRLGAGITPAWFRQDHAHLPKEKSLYDCVADARPTWSRGQIQEHLGKFGFSGDEVKRITDTLSGGERARVALALITLQGSNLLALDEPTNHLDVESIEALEDALDGYPGTVLLVSHDRALLRELSNRVWAFRNGKLLDYPGPFVDWERKVAEEQATQAAAALEAQREDREAKRLRSRKAADLKRKEGAPLRAARREVEGAEHAVQEAEERIAEMEAALASPELYRGSPEESAREAARLGAALKDARRVLNEAMDRWTRAMARLDEMSQDNGG
ncbi:MAG: ABC-F family ATP-binding cassette domain-containing protein [Gemmatimonadota bacterium]|jgi:ATP-binding cassette subfamily F protein 3